MSQAIAKGMRNLEAASAPCSQMFVVFADSDVGHEREIARLKAAGTANEADTFVCIMRFGGADHVPAPIIQQMRT